MSAPKGISINVPVLPVPQGPTEPPVVLINSASWARRFSTLLGAYVPAKVLSEIQQDVVYLRRNIEDLDKLGFSVGVPPPSFTNPALLDLALLAIFDLASEAYTAAGKDDEPTSEALRRLAGRTHKVVRRLRRALRQGTEVPERDIA